MTSIKDLLRKLPATPGVYQFLDAEGKIIYIGKAKSLKNRVKSYFQKSQDQSPKTERLLQVVKDLKWIETGSEVEALTLEANLVREHQPKFNVLLRDDKHFLYFKVTTQEDFPQIQTVRRVEKDGAKYFGPKTEGKSVQDAVKLIQKLFKLRVCNLGLEEQNEKVVVTKKTIKYPCIYQHINLCAAPCVGAVNKAEYAEQVQQTLAFLAGDSRPIVQALQEKMQTAAVEKKFELAAQLRDKLRAIQGVSERQLVSDPDLASRDVLGIKIEFGKAYLALLQIRNGKLIDSKNFTVKTGESDLPEVLAGFLVQYFELTTDYPDEILLPAPAFAEATAGEEEKVILEEWLKERAGRKVSIMVPQKGKKERLTQLAEKNAAAYAVQSKARFENATEKTVGAAAELARQLGIDKELKRIEAYDISHFSGDATVGSMVVFERGEPKNSDYRQFKIKSLAKGEVNDYASLAEIVGRRMDYLIPQEIGFRIRRGQKKDLKFLEPYFLKDFETQKLISRIQDFFVVEQDKKIIAWAQLIYWKKEKLSVIYSLNVLDVYRGKKLGLKLLKKMLQLSKADKIYLSCAKDLINYYGEIGFRALNQAPEFLEKNLKIWSELHPEFDYQSAVFLVWNRRTREVDTSFASKPDLVILDGGKGQLSAVLKNVKFPKGVEVVALAKREEEIFRVQGSGVRVQGSKKNDQLLMTNDKLKKHKAQNIKSKTKSLTTNYERVLLPRDSQAMYLVQRLRDEAHRFANNLREKLQDPARKNS